MRSLALEQIYDAAFDDEALRVLAVDLAATLEARSALIHWIHEDGSADVLAHSGYFSDEQLALYGREFAAIDPWVSATAAPECANRVIDLEAIVPVKLFAASDFYNDYVRSMGDDTGRCIGVRLQNGNGSGFIALQRGISQPGFQPTAVTRLQHYSRHLMRMLAMRGRLIAAERNTSELDAVVAALGYPAILVDSSMRVKRANHAAECLLASGESIEQRRGKLRAVEPRAQKALEEAIQAAVSGSADTVGAVALNGHAAQRIDLSITSVRAAGGARLALVLASDPLGSDDTRVRRLRDLYGLSAGEACLAVMLAQGLSPRDIAEQRRVAIGTVRVQIKQIAFKLGCHRQSEIVRIVSSLPLLSQPR